MMETAIDTVTNQEKQALEILAVHCIVTGESKLDAIEFMQDRLEFHSGVRPTKTMCSLIYDTVAVQYNTFKNQGSKGNGK